MEELEEKGVSIIGLPGSGKTTVGRILADRLGYRLLDIDEWTVKRGGPIPEILEQYGDPRIRELQAECIATENLRGAVVSTPGCVVYTTQRFPEARAKLQAETDIVWLDVDPALITARIQADANSNRVVIGADEKGFDAVVAERLPLYQALAGYTITCATMTPDGIAGEIINTVPSLAQHR